MPTSFNAFFRQNSPRRLSNVGKEQQEQRPPSTSSSLHSGGDGSGSGAGGGKGSSRVESEAASSESDLRSDDSKATTITTSSSTPSLAQSAKGKTQRSLPPIATRTATAGARDIPAKSSSVPSIELVSPSGANQQHIWGPGEDSDRNSNASPPLGVFGSAQQTFASNVDQSFSISPRQQPSATFTSRIQQQEPEQKSSDEDEEYDPLFAVTPSVQRKMARPMSSQGKGRTEGLTSNGKRGGKGDLPDRHDIMRRAMAEAVGSESFGLPGSNEGRNDERTSGLNVDQQRRPSLIEASTIKSPPATGLPMSQSSSSIIDHDKPGTGSLTFDHFSDSAGEGEVVLANSQNNQVGSAGMTKSGSQDNKKSTRTTPGRPKLGSRNNSFSIEADTDGVRDSPTRISQTFDTPSSANTSPVKQKTPGHGRYATTGHTVEPVRSKQTSLAVPGGNGMLEVRNGKQDSLLPSPLNKIRRLSDAGSIAGKRGTSPSGGIAGAIAASGLAGMGVGHAELLQRSQAQISEREAAAAAAAAANKKGRSRTSSMMSTGNNEYASGYEGGVYRDPVTGKMTERGPDGQDHPDDSRSRYTPLHSRSATNLSTVSLEGSEASFGSGLNAAANFALGLHDPVLSPEDPLKRAEGESAPLTPGGIGAVGGLSPSGLGERVTLADNEWDADDMGAQITGFAVASSKRNADFHAQFPAVPEDDYLIEDYGCALVREILIQGRLFVSENHVCFYANIFGWVTNIVMPFSEIVSVEKRMTAYVIPNAIQIATLHAKSTFASFLSRDTTYDLIVNIWKLSHPSLRPSETYDVGTDDESVDAADGATVIVTEQDEKVKADGKTETPAKKSKRNILKKKLGIKDGGVAQAIADAQANGGDTNSTVAGAIVRGKSPAVGGAKRQPHRKTTCNCEKEKKHFATVALDTTYPAVPEKIYNLIFTSGFMKEFWTDNQKLMDLQMSDWSPNAQNNNMLSRDMSYIKPLSGGFGPKQTKCCLTDENIHVDFDEYVTTMTTTRTPDVPSGGSFSVKTRTCITWEGGGNVSRILVTCMVEWSGRSMLKSVIDRASIDGQKQYYKDLDSAIRSYIKQHASEFREEGEDPEAAVAAITEHAEGGAEEKAGSAAEGTTTGTSSDADKNGLAKYVDMAQPVIDIISGAVGGLADLSPTVLILGAVVLLLIISNLWALSSSSGSSRDPLDPHRLRSSHPRGGKSSTTSSHYSVGGGGGGAHHIHDAAASADAVAIAVREVLRDYFEPHGHHAAAGGRVQDANKSSPKLAFEGDVVDPAQEVSVLLNLLDDVEARVLRLRSHLQGMQKDVKG